VTVVIGAGTVAADAPPVDFQRDVLPIRTDRCLTCHGFDEANRQSGLRLDTHAGATAALAGVASPSDRVVSAFVPGDIERSEAWRRIVSDEESERMPPPEAGPPLMASQRAVLKAWIEQGEEYIEHWLFALLRRHCLDLTGLPPSPVLRLEFLRGPREELLAGGGVKRGTTYGAPGARSRPARHPPAPAGAGSGSPVRPRPGPRHAVDRRRAIAGRARDPVVVGWRCRHVSFLPHRSRRE
jgi:hypothetical protein